MDPEQFNIVHKEGQQPFQDHQGSNVHLHAGPYPKQEPGEIPATSHMGPPPSGITNLTAQAFQPSNYTHPLTPYWSSLPPAVHTGRGTHTFMVSTHVCPKHTPNTPTPNLQQVLQQHHLGKFLTFYLLG